MKKFFSLVFGVVKRWLKRNQKPPTPLETKQKINLVIAGDNNNVVITFNDNNKD